jgi:hypothetical protein
LALKENSSSPLVLGNGVASTKSKPRMRVKLDKNAEPHLDYCMAILV